MGIAALTVLEGARPAAAQEAAPAGKSGLAPSRNEAADVPTREELQRLTPAEREARAERLRERKAIKAGQPPKLTPAERDQRRAEIHLRLQRRLDQLRAKQKTTELNPEERKQLKRLEEVSKGFQKPRAERPVDPASPALK